MLNAIHPPIHFLEKLLDKYIHLHLEKEQIENILLDLDEKIGRGETEKEAKEMVYWFDLDDKKYDVFFKNKIDKDELDKKFFKTNNFDVYDLYKVKTKSYVWFILINKKERYQKDQEAIMMVPTEDGIFPLEMKQKVADLIEQHITNALNPS